MGSGRRGLTNTKLTSLVDLRRRLRVLGASPELLRMLEPAIEADCFLEGVLAVDSGRELPEYHPLATQVIRRPFAELLAWPFTGVTPAPIAHLPPVARRGPTPEGPQLAKPARERFFHHLRALAERSRAGRSELSAEAILLRRQVYYLAAWDSSEDAQRWLADMERDEERHPLPRHRWTPAWASRRSLLVARARKGDPEPLRRFIRNHIDCDELEAANLNYWAYWIEETPDVEHADDFMTGDLGVWGGAKLLRRLHDSLVEGDSLLDLTTHSIWALLKRRPWLLTVDRALTASLYHRVTTLITSPELSAATHRELDQIEYGMKISPTHS